MHVFTEKELSHIIKRIQLNENEVIVLIDTTEEKSLQEKFGMQNIFLINKNNEVLWQVNVINSTVNLKDTFVYVDFNKEGNLNADTFFGMEYLIDINTGTAKRVGWHK